MVNNRKIKGRISSSYGFTLLEMMVAAVITAGLAAIAVSMYTRYVDNARAADILLKYEAIRSKVDINLEIDGGMERRCADISASVGPGDLHDEYARLSIHFEAVGAGGAPGYRPVLAICARSSKQGSRAVGVVRAAHQELERAGHVEIETGAELTDAMASFAVPLTANKSAVCRVPEGTALTACGEPVAVPALPATAAMAVPKPVPRVAPPQQAIAVPKIQAFVMKFSGTDTYIRPAGGTLDTQGDLGSLTLDMSFIGEGSIPAAAGGAGPVMFNYGDASNGHNAVSLWNPHSLNVALLGVNHDTGLDVADGKTHRVTVTWDGATGKLSVYDNGALVKTFENVSAGQSIKGGGTMVVAHKGEPPYSSSEAFAGQIFGASFANTALTAEQAREPMHQVLDAKTGLLIDIRVDQRSGAIVDTTGRANLEAGGVMAVQTGVEGNLVTPP